MAVYEKTGHKSRATSIEADEKMEALVRYFSSTWLSNERNITISLPNNWLEDSINYAISYAKKRGFDKDGNYDLELVYNILNLVKGK